MGKLLIDYVFDWLIVVGVKCVVVNVYYLVSMLEVYLIDWFLSIEIMVFDECVWLMEMGGGFV